MSTKEKTASMVKKLNCVLVLTVVIALILSACGNGVDSDSPKGVVRAFFDKLENQDETGVKDLLCPDFRQNVNFEIAGDQEARMTFSLKYKIEGQDEATADVLDVTVYGTVEVTLETEHVRIKREEKHDEEVAWSVRVAKFDDKWLVCGGDAYMQDLLDIHQALAQFSMEEFGADENGPAEDAEGEAHD